MKAIFLPLKSIPTRERERERENEREGGEREREKETGAVKMTAACCLASFLSHKISNSEPIFYISLH